MSAARRGHTSMTSIKNPPLRVCFDTSAHATLRRVLLKDASYFIEHNARTADVIIFGRDDLGYIRASEHYALYKEKCICISETDTPTYRLPGLYAANQFSLNTFKRTKTINYFISEHDRPNPHIRRFVNERVSKTFLYSFMGASNSWARKRLFRYVRPRSDTFIEATDTYNHWSTDPAMIAKQANQSLRYAQIMASSKFSLCPRGCGLSSYRLFESMSLGIAPVIISDRWRPIEEIDWSFALFVSERRIPDIDSLVRAHESEWLLRGEAARREYDRVFREDHILATLYQQIIELNSLYDPKREFLVKYYTEMSVLRRDASLYFYNWTKYLVMRACYLSGIEIPFTLHQPLEEQLGRGRPSWPRFEG